MFLFRSFSYHLLFFIIFHIRSILLLINFRQGQADDVKRQSITKAYALLLALTVAALGIMTAVQGIREERVPTVETVTVKRKDMKETVVCTGTVGTAGGTEVFASVPCVAGDVAVSVGDRVEKGEVLLTVDRASTLAMAVSAGIGEAAQSGAQALLPEAIVAPCTGIVSAVGAVKGDTITTATPCVVLSENGGIVIDAVVRENVLSSIAVGQAVTVSGVAFDKKAYHGRLTAIASSARTRVSGTSTETVVDAVVTLDEGEADASLLLGLTAKVTVTVAVYADVVTVPYECLTQEDGQTAVYCIQGETAVKRAVETGKEFATGVEIVTGLQGDERIVKAPEQLKGAAVRVRTEGAA